MVNCRTSRRLAPAAQEQELAKNMLDVEEQLAEIVKASHDLVEDKCARGSGGMI